MMATNKKSKNNSNTEFTPDNNESTTDVEQKIELISSTDPKISTFSDDLQSEIDLFESELDESININNDPEPRIKEVTEENMIKEESEAQNTQDLEEKKAIEEPQVDQKKPKKTRTRKSKKDKKSESSESEKTEKTESAEIDEPTKPKKSRTRKSKKAKDTEKKETEFQEAKNTETSTENTSSESSNTEPVKEPVKNIIEEELVDINLITDSISDSKIQASVLALYNERAELKASLEKSKKILRIFKKKLMLAEEREDQWKACAYTLGDFFASKSNMALEDVLRRFEAPLEELDE